MTFYSDCRWPLTMTDSDKTYERRQVTSDRMVHTRQVGPSRTLQIESERRNWNT